MSIRYPPTDPPRSYNPWNEPLATWKALLKPTAAGIGPYQITATCTGCAGVASVSIGNIAFGDMVLQIRPRLRCLLAVLTCFDLF